jgi:hypothetical protein
VANPTATCICCRAYPGCRGSHVLEEALSSAAGEMGLRKSGVTLIRQSWTTACLMEEKDVGCFPVCLSAECAPSSDVELVDGLVLR